MHDKLGHSEADAFKLNQRLDDDDNLRRSKNLTRTKRGKRTLLNDGQNLKGCREVCTAGGVDVACTNKAGSKRHLYRMRKTEQILMFGNGLACVTLENARDYFF